METFRSLQSPRRKHRIISFQLTHSLPYPFPILQDFQCLHLLLLPPPLYLLYYHIPPHIFLTFIRLSHLKIAVQVFVDSDFFWFWAYQRRNVKREKAGFWLAVWGLVEERFYLRGVVVVAMHLDFSSELSHRPVRLQLQFYSPCLKIKIFWHLNRPSTVVVWIKLLTRQRSR